ncbi:AraC family transcriptional regulator [Rhodanobacter sp. IGA1.0]|uniref:AraC family transcriptional regulator n=1 Tax=Rhodanobacter sp. IGA1.0 TaxID=3158582 RepID=A0AAU7QIF9_9GAMM
MIDPLAEIVTLLQPAARFSKVVVGAGRWRVRREEVGQPFYCVVIDGSCRLKVDDDAPIMLHAGDFVLIPAAQNFTMTSQEALTPEDVDSPPMPMPDGEFRLGHPAGPPDVRLLVGHCSFASPDVALLVSLLPRLVHVRDDKRRAAVVQLVADESRARRPARDVILSRLLEVLFIEALRSGAGTAASPGLLHGLADTRLAEAIRQMHENPARPWTVAQLAKAAALSRSAFFERFSRAVGIAPMAYLLAWRMALAKQLLRRREGALTEVAERVGYSSASTFSVAFARHVGQSPMRYARAQG